MEEKILGCYLVRNGYLLFTSDCKYHITYDDNMVELLIMKPDMVGTIFPTDVVNEKIDKIDESETVITIHTSAGLLTFSYDNGIGSMKMDDVVLHQFQYMNAKDIYFATYTEPYKYVYLTNLDKPYKLNRIYNHIYFDGSIESFNPLKLRYIVNDEHLTASTKEFEDTLGAIVDKVVDYKKEE